MTETTPAATMFASKTPRQLNRDPWPYVDSDGIRWYAEEGVCWPETGPDAGQIHEWSNTLVYDPRPEYDAVQTLKPNLILVEFRRTKGRGRAGDFVKYLTIGDVYDWRHYGDEMKTHALRVLTRLANAEAAPPSAVKVFASRIPEQLNADPFPYVWPEHLRRNRHTKDEPRSEFSHADGLALVWEPRPEYSHAQHNPASSYLAFCRYERNRNPRYCRYEYLLWGCRPERAARLRNPELAHAYRVLNRLANLEAATAD